MLFSKNLSYFYLEFGRHISVKLKVQRFGIWMEKFLDMSLMGVGTNILGYNNSQVDKKVIETVNKGNMSTLNCPEEVELAETNRDSSMGRLC